MKNSGAASPGRTNITNNNNNANTTTTTTTTTTSSTTALSPNSNSISSSSSSNNNNNNNNNSCNNNSEDNNNSNSNNSNNNNGGVQSNRNGINGKRNGYMKLNICPATGGQIEINVPEKETVAGLKWNLSRKFRISTEKMTLLFKDRPLKEGSLLENQVTEFSRIYLFPNMESGITFHRTDVGVIQALENLSESQVNDFLSGRAPLLLAMKLGDHMMFVQLQLSTSSCTQRSQTKHAQCSSETKDKGSSVAVGPVFNSTALAELGHNLSQKLRELSKLSTHPRVPGDHCGSATAAAASSATPTATATATATATPPDTSFPVSEKQQSIPVVSPVKPSATLPNAPSPVTQPPPTVVAAPIQASSVTPSPAAATGNNAKSCSSEPISGAIIENMQHIGQGVYSGTFSGTLDPSLQDLDGKPKRNISTIIHILNDLLGATPQYRIESPTSPHNDRNLLQHSMENKGGSAGFPGNQSEENNALRGKVKDIQMKMEEKRLRRRARRETPYPCNGIGHCSSPMTTPTTTTTSVTTNNNGIDNSTAVSSLHLHHHQHHPHHQFHNHHHLHHHQQQHSSPGSFPGPTQMDVDEFKDTTTTTATTTITASNNTTTTELGGKAAEIEMMPVAPTATASSSSSPSSSSSSSSLPSSSSSSTSSSQAAENASYTSSNLEQESVLV